MHSRQTFFLVLLVVASAAAGCKSEESKPGKWFTCSCPYLTDFDGMAKHSLEVCVPEGTKPVDAARGCASKLAHGPVETCTCEPPGEACDGLKACKSNEYK
jgi:hypothetical protein